MEVTAPTPKPKRPRQRSAEGIEPPPSSGRKKGTRASAPVADLVVELAGPGMTPLLRAGAGGLAASLRWLAIEADRKCRWPSPVAIADGTAEVFPTRIILRFGPTGPATFLEDLFRRSFRILDPGLICPIGTTAAPTTPPLGLAIALQVGMKRTFLQHGKSTTKQGSERTVQAEIDGRLLPYRLQPYAAYKHSEEGAAGVLFALEKGHVELAGWAYPGAAQRHVAAPESKCEYGPAHALAAMFALVGAVSHPGASGGSGVLVVPTPDDLVVFAATRALITPRTVAEAYVTGVGDALLAMSLDLKVSGVMSRPGVGGAVGWLLQKLPWATQQKSRSLTIESGVIADARLDAYERVCAALPPVIRERAPSGDDASDEDGFFVATSALRGFITDNLARSRRWFEGFATATTSGKRPRFIHYYRDRERGLGALFPEEKKGLIAMLEDLDEAEKVLVRSVHLALRGRFARIAKDADNPATMKNRFTGERERLRIAFAGAKTGDQVRAALADLWSRGGTNRELQAGWTQILPLLRPDQWMVARDLALVALASYQGASRVEEDDGEADTTDSIGTGDGGR